MSYGQKMKDDAIHFLMGLADNIRSQSHDSNRQVGCVVVTSGALIMTTNRIPEWLDSSRPERREQNEKPYWLEHAELSAIFKAAERGVSLRGAQMYCTRFPCDACARGILSSGISRLVCPDAEIHHPRWGEKMKRANVILQESGRIDVVTIPWKETSPAP